MHIWPDFSTASYHVQSDGSMQRGSKMRLLNQENNIQCQFAPFLKEKPMPKAKQICSKPRLKDISTESKKSFAYIVNSITGFDHPCGIWASCVGTDNLAVHVPKEICPSVEMPWFSPPDGKHTSLLLPISVLNRQQVCFGAMQGTARKWIQKLLCNCVNRVRDTQQ